MSRSASTNSTTSTAAAHYNSTNRSYSSQNTNNITMAILTSELIIVRYHLISGEFLLFLFILLLYDFHAYHFWTICIPIAMFMPFITVEKNISVFFLAFAFIFVSWIVIRFQSADRSIFFSHQSIWPAGVSLGLAIALFSFCCLLAANRT